MSAPSTFQTLPWHIIESVVDFHISSFNCRHNADKTLATAILHSCHNWRSIFINKTCSVVQLDFQKSATFSFSFPNWPKALNQPDILTGRSVKTVDINIGLGVLNMDGSALAQLLQSSLADVVFPAALTLRFAARCACTPLIREPINPAAAVQNVIVILRKFRQMALTIQQVEMSWPEFFYQYTSGQSGEFLSQIAEELYRGVSGISIQHNCNLFCLGNLGPLGQLRMNQLAFGESSNPVWTVECIQRNAASLKTLSLGYLDIQTTTALLRNVQEGPVVYRCLESFEFICRGHTDVSIISRLSAAAAATQPTDTTVYFPALKSCKLNGPYPFVDDAPFRGNSRTLKKLDINITAEFIDIADKFCIFTGSKFPSVQYIGLTYVSPYLITGQYLETRFQEFVLQILPALGASTRIHTFKLSADVDKDMIFKCIRELSVLNRLQVIEFPTLPLNFAGIVAIMQHAPYLQKLRCLPTNVAPSIDGIGKIKIWRHVNSISGTFGRHFHWLALDSKCWTVTMDRVKSITLIAIACPQFAKLDIDEFIREQFNESINRLAGYKYLSKFADRIKSLAV